MDLKHFKARYEHVKVQEHQNNVSENPMVSICVQTYQHVNFIEACLEGILNQKTNFQFEILLGEDSSTDGTRQICIEYANKYPERIRLFLHHRENNIYIGGKPSGRFNFMFNLLSARGKYIALCEGDDYWTDPLKLQKQVDFLEANPDYVICCHNAKIINENGEHIQDKKLPYLTEDRDYTSFELQQGAFLLTMSLLFRNVGVVFPKEFNGVLNGDKVLISLLGNYGKGRYIENIIPAVYRVHSGGVWSSLKEFNQRLVKRKLNYAFMKYYQENEELYSFFYNEQRELSIYLMKNIKEAESFKSYLDFNLFYIRFNSVFSSKKKLKKFLRLSKRYWVS